MTSPSFGTYDRWTMFESTKAIATCPGGTPIDSRIWRRVCPSAASTSLECVAGSGFR